MITPRINLIFLLTLGFVSNSICFSQEQTDKLEVYNKEFGWRMTVPDDFKIGTNTHLQATQKKLNFKFLKDEKPVFFLLDDPYAYFFSASEPYNTASKKTYQQHFRQKSISFYETIRSDKPNEKVDSISGEVLIDSLKFSSFSVIRTITDEPSYTLYFTIYGRKFGNKEISILIMSFGKPPHDTLDEAFRNSKFEKR